jgi:hypothetical protein
MVGIAQRFHIPVSILARNVIETHADLDSYAEVDLVSYQFVKDNNLTRITAISLYI